MVFKLGKDEFILGGDPAEPWRRGHTLSQHPSRSTRHVLEEERRVAWL